MDELYDIIFFQIYVPFVSAILFIVGYVYHSDEKIKETLADLDKHTVSRQEVEDIVDMKLESVKEMQKLTMETLKQVSENVGRNNAATIRIEERLMQIDKTIERRSEIRANNTIHL